MSEAINIESGFTLVEMSIVIVIIGIIISTIIMAREIVHNAQISAVISELQQFEASIRSFSLQYNGLPGDIRKASRYWPDCAATDVPPNLCNGNENGKIDAISDPVNGEEGLRAWQHLAYAHLLAAGASGVLEGSGNDEVIINSNLPSSQVKGGGYVIDFDYLPPDDTNFIGLAAKDPASPNKKRLEGSILKPIEAWSVDKKLDDGLPGKGIIHAFDGSDQPLKCITAGPPKEYIHDGPNKACSIAFRFSHK